MTWTARMNRGLSWQCAQVNLDFEDEADMVQKMRIGIALQPVATALFANSPFRDGGDTGAQAPSAPGSLPGVLGMHLACAQPVPTLSSDAWQRK